MPVRNAHHVHGRPIAGEFSGLQTVQFGMGCFWARNASSGRSRRRDHRGRLCRRLHAEPDLSRSVFGETGHAEVVLVAYDPARVSFDTPLKTLLGKPRSHPGMRQGNDAGTQYRSAIYRSTQAQYDAAIASRDVFQENCATPVTAMSPPRSCFPHRRSSTPRTSTSNTWPRTRWVTAAWAAPA